MSITHLLKERERKIERSENKIHDFSCQDREYII